MTDFKLDRHLIDALVAGTLDRRGDATLAEQVARVLPYHWTLPNPHAAALTTLRHHLGDTGLLEWLDRHPGRPRLVARMYGLIGLIDEVSGEPALVNALRDLRSRDGDPPELTDYLVPDTDSKTLASLGTRIESLLGEDRLDEAVTVANATVDMLRRAAAPGQADPKLRELPDRLDLLSGQIRDAAADLGGHA